MADCECVPAPAGAIFASDEILLYGIRLNIQPAPAPPLLPEAHLSIHPLWNVALRPIWLGGGVAPPFAQIVLVYGYAYQGHCYRLDKQKILAFNGQNNGVHAIGCHFEFPFTNPTVNVPTNIPLGWYRMWGVRASNYALEMQVSYDRFEKLILEANLPGRRAPNTYEAQAQLAHRGGRVTGLAHGT